MSRMLLVLICFCWHLICISAQKLHLSKPNCNVQMAMVSKSNPAIIEYDFRMDGANIHFTTDGSEPSIRSTKYTQPIRISKPCEVKARVYHQDFLPSEVVKTTLVGAGYELKSFDGSAPNTKYYANGINTLFNGKFGNDNYTIDYVGYDAQIEITITNDIKQAISKVNISSFVNQGAWIFAPFSISIFNKNGKKIGEKLYAGSLQKTPLGHQLHVINIPKRKYDAIKLLIKPIESIPLWHDGRGLKAWIFLDEIWVN